MEVSIHPFKLLYLSEKPITTILNLISKYDLVSLSLCSRKALGLVKNLNLQAHHIDVRAGEVFSVNVDLPFETIVFIFREDVRNLREPKDLRVDYVVGKDLPRFNDDDRICDPKWRNPKFSGKDWIGHILTVFNQTKIERMFVLHSGFDVESMWNVLKDFEKSRYFVAESRLEEYNLKVLKYFKSMEDVKIDCDGSQRTLQNTVLLGNFTNLQMELLDAKIEIDQLLLINSVNVLIDSVRMRCKDLNRFLKLWKAALNCRVRTFTFNFLRNTVLDENLILRGINHRVAPIAEEREYSRNDGRVTVIRGGFDFIGKRGKKATVVLDTREFYPGFKMFVWD